jgi:ATP-dependent exoDNAse (exonuclease V) beta subunit
MINQTKKWVFDMDSIFLKLEEAFSDVFFIQKNHTYKIKGNPSKSSVSGVIKKYESVFDSQNISEKIAKKRGVSQSEILEEWDFKREYSCHKGSEFHLFVENFLARKQISIDDDSLSLFFNKHKNFLNENSINTYKEELKKLIKNFIMFYNWWKKDHILFKSEFVIGDEQTGICGTIDNLSYNKKTNEFVIFDYKTNKEIKNKNEYGEKMLGILSHLDKCEFVKYSLQLSLYSTIIEKITSIKIPNSYIIWVNGEDTFECIKTLDLKKESLMILNDFL